MKITCENDKEKNQVVAVCDAALKAAGVQARVAVNLIMDNMGREVPVPEKEPAKDA